MKYLALALALVLLVPAASALAQSEERAFPVTVTQAEIAAKYAAVGQGGEKVKVLIMPGHEPNYGGAEQNGLRERDIVVTIADKLAADLAQDPRFEVTVARDTTEWLPALADYFEEEWKNIQRFVSEYKRAAKTLLRHGDLADRDFEVAHNIAATDVAYRLYGVTRYADENDYDIVVHLHLNDNTGAEFQSGFAVYIPDAQFGNADASKPLGAAIASELSRFNASSTLPIENYAIVEDQDLIAVGAYNTAQFATALIEYAYIYESKITHPEARDAVLSDMARQTYRGLRDYVGVPSGLGDTTVLPYAWAPEEITPGKSSPQIYALQAALKKLGFYPPAGELLVGCPISGFAGDCTISALKNFQKSKGLEQTGSIGPRTAAALAAAGY